jgi:DNA-binding NarL/FixJ family response regulator
VTRARRGWDVAIVEVAYRAAASSPSTWLTDVFEAVRPALDLGGGVVAYEYDTTRPRECWLATPIADDPTLARAVEVAYGETPHAINDWIHKRAGAVTILSEVIDVLPRRHPELAPHLEKRAASDVFGINAADPTGRGTYFCAMSDSVVPRTGDRISRWENVAAHLAAAGRLRRALAGAPLGEAVLSPDGRVVHAGRRAQESLDELKQAARAMDAARRRGTRDSPEALEWSLVEEFERDGRRFLIAHPNAPTAPDPRRLTAVERMIAGYVAMGHANKLIAYELGLSLGTVSGHLYTIFRKLGVRRRVELVERARLLATGPAVEVGELRVVASRPSTDISGELTRAEAAVARLAVRGLSNAAIARERGASPRTIANQLARIFAKLGVRSRSELALRLP